MRHGGCSTYTLVFQHNTYTLGGDLRTLSTVEKFSEGSPLEEPLSVEDAQLLVSSAPFIIDRGLNLDRVYERDNFQVYRDCDGRDIQTLLKHTPVPEEKFRTHKEPLTFSQVVLAAALGILGAIFVLSFL